MITKYQPAKWPGRYRAGGVFVTSADRLEPAYTGPEAELVPGLMNELIEWLRDGDPGAPAYARAAMAHLNLVGIHPWRDGNGRTARALHTLVLARTGELAPEFSSIEEWLGEQINTIQYYEALRSVQNGSFQPDRDAHSWLKFVFAAHHRQAQRVKRRSEWTVRLWTDLAPSGRRARACPIGWCPLSMPPRSARSGGPPISRTRASAATRPSATSRR